MRIYMVATVARLWADNSHVLATVATDVFICRSPNTEKEHHHA